MFKEIIIVHGAKILATPCKIKISKFLSVSSLHRETRRYWCRGCCIQLSSWLGIQLFLSTTL